MARKKQTAAEHTPVEALRHQDRRANIPTHELSGFVAEEERAPKPVLYPRDPSLDPQLVWRGKDEQDASPLSVESVPIYIQEKIQPRVILDEVRAQAAGERSGEQLDLFSDFNGIDLEKQIQFYQHDQNWTNRMILGDSLQVMTSLADKERLKGQVQMIYMDPPYGIKFGSNWQVSTRKRDVKDGKAEDLTRQPEQIRAFRDTWELGIHSYLAYLRDRLTVARELLTESGSVFVQIGDENVHLVRCVLDEVFGRENFVGLITFKKTTGAGSFAGGTNVLASINDYLVWYARDLEVVKYRPLYRLKEYGGTGGGQYTWIERLNGERVRLGDAEPGAEERIFRPDQLTSQTTRVGQTTVFPVELEGRTFAPAKGGWKTNREGMSRLKLAQRLLAVGNTLSYVRFLADFPAFPFSNLWDDTVTSGFADPKTYVVQTNSKVVQRCMLMTTDPGDLVLDPTCGSGTTAYVAEQWGRRWITTDTSRVALALARTRLMTATFKYYLLADSPEGIAKESELTGVPLPPRSTGRDVRKGFVYRRVPHVTLKAIANNAEIDEIHENWQAALEPLRTALNKARKTTWQEWEIPREPGADWSADAKRDLERWWQARRKRQEEIDASIARNSETEPLVDQPFEDPRKLRVTGPFTVESLSPHRVLAPDLELPKSMQAAQTDTEAVGFVPMILENLRKAGIQNTRKAERLVLDTLEPWSGGLWIHAAGTYTEKDGAVRRVAVSIGPEHGTVGKEGIVDAAKEAVKGTGFDLLVVMGFAFDPHASEAAREVGPELDGFAVAEGTRQFGRLPVLLARMNPDLAMGDALKKTGAGNLFMVFGEPDIRIHPVAGNGKAGKSRQLTVEIRGLDIFDPTTGAIRPSSTDDIACWFLDTDYNEESFFVRHAYFTGGDEPYDKLKRALRAEIDEAAWSALYSTVSRPFEVPRSGKIAVKVINHYGDEVLKVYSV